MRGKITLAVLETGDRFDIEGEVEFYGRTLLEFVAGAWVQADSLSDRQVRIGHVTVVSPNVISVSPDRAYESNGFPSGVVGPIHIIEGPTKLEWSSARITHQTFPAPGTIEIQRVR